MDVEEKNGADDQSYPDVSGHVTENDSATASTHSDVFAPDGRATHVPPPVAQASSQLWPSEPNCHETPEFPQAQSPPGR